MELQVEHGRMRVHEHGHVARPVEAVLLLATGYGAAVYGVAAVSGAWARLAVLLVAVAQLGAAALVIRGRGGEAAVAAGLVGVGLVAWVVAEALIVRDYDVLQPIAAAIGVAEYGLARRMHA